MEMNSFISLSRLWMTNLNGVIWRKKPFRPFNLYWLWPWLKVTQHITIGPWIMSKHSVKFQRDCFLSVVILVIQLTDKQTGTSEITTSLVEVISESLMRSFKLCYSVLPFRGGGRGLHFQQSTRAPWSLNLALNNTPIKYDCFKFTLFVAFLILTSAILFGE